jgi:hypothetical protein
LPASTELSIVREWLAVPCKAAVMGGFDRILISLVGTGVGLTSASRHNRFNSSSRGLYHNRVSPICVLACCRASLEQIARFVLPPCTVLGLIFTRGLYAIPGSVLFIFCHPKHLPSSLRVRLSAKNIHWPQRSKRSHPLNRATASCFSCFNPLIISGFNIA